MFEKTYKNILNTYKKLQKKLTMFIRKIRWENANLIGLVQVNPIYIINK